MAQRDYQYSFEKRANGGPIDLALYQRRASCLRSQSVWQLSKWLLGSEVNSLTKASERCLSRPGCLSPAS